MTDFLIVAGIGTVLVVVLLIWPVLTGVGRASRRDDADAAIYRDQLAELDREVARGAIGEAEAEGARAEVARRLIIATRRARDGVAPARAPRRQRMRIALLLPAFIAILTGYLYFGSADLIRSLGADPAKLRDDYPLEITLRSGKAISLWGVLAFEGVGAPGAEDCPLEDCAAKRAAQTRASMPSQAEAERRADGLRSPPPELDPEFVKLIERLEKIVESRPMDLQGRRLLARNLAGSGRWVDARKAYDKLVEILGPNASAEDHAGHAEAMIFAAAGYVSPEAMSALQEALRKDPGNTMGRYYAGFALRQSGRPQEAVRLWQALLAEDRAAAEPRGAEWRAALMALIAETSGEPAPGPTREEVDAAEKMTPEERQAMIAGMVARLEERLATQGGEAEEWVRLIRAYLKLGKTDDARRIYALAQERLDEPTARSFVREQALVLGLKLE